MFCEIFEFDAVIEAPNDDISRLPSGNLLVVENPEDGAWSVKSATTIVAQLLFTD